MRVLRKLIPCIFKITKYECNNVENKENKPLKCGECNLYKSKISIPRFYPILTASDYAMVVAKIESK